MQQGRDLSFDAFRGAAIIAVIAIHATAGGVSWMQSTPSGWNSHFLTACRQLCNFAVPAFIFISGYWASKKPINPLEDYKTFLARRIPRVLIPYLFWSFFLLAYDAIRTGNVNLQEIIFKLMTGRATAGYFFIIVIIQLYLITPLLQCINRKPYGLVLVLILNIVSLLVAYLSRLYNHWIPVSSAFYSWIIFYEIGLLAGKNDNKVLAQKNMRIFILPAILVTLLISVLETTILLSKCGYTYFALSPVKYSSFLYSICIIFGFLFVRERIRYWPKYLISIGNCSFGIYLIHMPVLTQVINFVQKSDTIYSLQPLYQVIVVLITLSICFVLIRITRELLPKPFCRKILGF